MIEARQTPMGLAVVIVNYRTADLVLENLDALASACAAEARAEIIIVDNCSPTDDAARIAQALSERTFDCPVRLIASAVNGGFGAGNNIALREVLARESAPDFVFFLNPDAALRPGALPALASVMRDRPRCGFVGPRIIDGDGRGAVAAFRWPNVAGEFEQAARLGAVTALLGRFRIPMTDVLTARAVDWVSGAAFLCRTQALRDIGLFDETYFLYFEETDLMRRGAAAGWECWTAPEAEVVHLEGKSDVAAGAIDRVIHPSDYWYQSRAHFYRKFRGPAYAAAADAARIAGAVLAWARSRLSSKPDPRLWPEIRRFARKEFRSVAAPGDGKGARERP